MTTLAIDSAKFYDKISIDKKGNYLLSSFTKYEDKWVKGYESIIKFQSDSSLSISSKDDKKKITIRIFHKNNNGYLIKDFVNSILIEQGESKLIFPLIRIGYWKSFDYSTGKIRVQGTYNNNQVISNKFWITDTYFIEDVFAAVDMLPDYEGGMNKALNFVAEKLRYPESAKEGNISGKVIVGLIVKKDGSIDGLHLLQRVHPLLDLEAVRVINLIPKKWIPGEIDNNKVNVIIALPVSFSLR
jgi:hypothetical protein